VSQNEDWILLKRIFLTGFTGYFFGFPDESQKTPIASGGKNINANSKSKT
jgi:hypothetical protein